MKTGLVAGYATSCLLENCYFHVSENGRQKVIETQTKMVHAWVRGTLLEVDGQRPDGIETEVQYNPYTHTSFITEDQTMVERSEVAYFSNKKVYI